MKARLMALKILLSGIVCVGVVISFQNCSAPQAPGVTDLASRTAGVVHTTAMKQSCTACHIALRPTSPVGFPSFDHTVAKFGGQGDCVTCHVGNAGMTWAGAKFGHNPQPGSCIECHAAERPMMLVGNPVFDHTNPSFGGTEDCLSCHSASVGVSWVGGRYAHSPQPGSCITCHIAQRPTTLVGNPPFNHSLNGSGDCFGCHSQNTVNYNSMSDWAGGEGLPSGLIGAQTKTQAVQIPTFSGSTITAISSTTQGLTMQMLHTSTQFPSTMLKNCATCHAGAAAGNFTGGLFHANVTVQPTACLECHVNAQPTGFVGPNKTGRSPLSAEMRHEATTWSNATGTWAATKTPLVGQDCVTCHASTAAFSAAAYHSNLTTQPGSCIACHANSKPIGASYVQGFGPMPFDHSKAGGNGECITCHTVNLAAPTWANGNFNHTGVTSCASCHESQRPNSNTYLGTATAWSATPAWISKNISWATGTTTFDFNTHGGTQDCITCHAASSASAHTALSNWSGGHYPGHASTMTQCLTCHSYPQLTASAGGYLHSNAGTNDCVGCHSGTLATAFNSLTNWAGASGGGTAPTGLVQADQTKFSWASVLVDTVTLTYTTGTSYSTATTKTNLGVKLPLQFQHMSPAITAAGITVGTSCNQCHTVGTLSTSGTQFHSSLTRLGKAQPTASCASCHSPGAIPTGIANPNATSLTTTPTFDHNAKYGSGVAIVAAQDCATCHSKPGTSWRDGVFHSKVGTNTLPSCTACHFLAMPAGLILSPVVYTTVKGSKLPLHFSHTSTLVTQDCKTCHLQVGAGPTKPWSVSVAYHSKIATQPTACLNCHSTDFPATGQSNYDHSTIGATDCKSCHTASANPVWTGALNVPNGVVGPGNYVPTLYPARPDLDHAVKLTGGLTVTQSMACATCHTAGYTPTVTTRFHTNVLKASLASCMGCHEGRRLDRSASHFAGQDCKGCHSGDVGTNKWNGN